MKGLWILVVCATFSLPASLFSQDKGQIVEEIIARVNNDIITLSDYQKAEASLHDEVAQDCQGCSQEKIDALFQQQQKDLLRDLVDQSLLVQRAKDLGINVDTEVVKRLDQLRQQNNLPSMEALEKAVEAQGISWEDYKQSIQNNLLTQEVIRKEVGSRISIGSDEVHKYYNEHKSDFVRPEEVVLSEIFLSTADKTPEQVAAIRKKADDLLARIKKGEDFAALAERYSDGNTAKQGGRLGVFERGQLAKNIVEAVFKLDKGGVTDIISTVTGFEILKVDQHYDAGQQPLDKVEDEITNKLYMQKMQPSLRQYLTQLREDSYVVVKPGYVDTAAAASGNTVIAEVPPSAEAGGSKKKSKKRKRGQ